MLLSRGAALLALFGLLCTAAAASPSTLLTPVDDASFDALVLAAPEAWVLEFGSPRCGTCTEFAPLYEALAAKHGGEALRFGVVDIDEPAGMALATRLDVLSEGVPNVRAFVTRAAGADAGGARVFSGWQLPPAEELEAALLAAVQPAVSRGTLLRAGCAPRLLVLTLPQRLHLPRAGRPAARHAYHEGVKSCRAGHEHCLVHGHGS